MQKGDDFTQQEREVYLLLVNGLSNKEICNKMNVKRHYVERMVRQIMTKVGIRQRTKIIVHYYKSVCKIK